MRQISSASSTNLSTSRRNRVSKLKPTGRAPHPLLAGHLIVNPIAVAARGINPTHAWTNVSTSFETVVTVATILGAVGMETPTGTRTTMATKTPYTTPIGSPISIPIKTPNTTPTKTPNTTLVITPTKTLSLVRQRKWEPQQLTAPQQQMMKT